LSCSCCHGPPQEIDTSFVQECAACASS
jgi:hypothetical protein